MKTVEQLIAELQMEAMTTKKVLERITQAILTWKPHEKSMTVGRLSMHIAELPNWIIRCLESEEFDFGTGPYNPVVPDTTDQIMNVFATTIDKAVNALKKTKEEVLDLKWKLRRGEIIIAESSRRTFIRRQLNHLIHHRGQLSVYLRLLNIPVPSMYGPSADEKA